MASAPDWSGLEHVSTVVERLAVLLAAGIPPAASWGYLAESEAGESPPARVVRRVARAGVHRPLGREILEAATAPADPPASAPFQPRPRQRTVVLPEESAWRGLAAAWIVATDAGAPLSGGLRHFASSLRALAQTRREASVALAGPVATAKLILVLPLAGVLFGLALGFDPLGTLTTTPPGLVCLVLGSGLLLAGRAWNRRLVSASAPKDLTPGLVLDLFSIAVSGGASLDRARRTVARARQECGLAGHEDEAEPVLALARRAGVPAGALLRSEADLARRDAQSQAQRQAARLAVTLMMPLGLCILPAFLLLGVAPLMIAVLSSTVRVF